MKYVAMQIKIVLEYILELRHTVTDPSMINNSRILGIINLYLKKQVAISLYLHTRQVNTCPTHIHYIVTSAMM